MNLFKKKHITNLFFLWFLSLFTFGQNIQIIDKKTNKPIAFASVVLKDLSLKKSYQFISDTAGLFTLPSTHEYSVYIQALSYTDYVDTLSGKSNHRIILEPSHFNIDKIVVTGRLKPEPIDKSIYKVNILNQKDFEINAANDLGEILKTTVGFQYRSEGVLGDFIRIQGLTGEHIKILIDGIPVSGRSGSIIDLSQINLYYIDHIEIIEGPMSVIYGSNAMAIINVISKRPINKSFSMNVSAFYETVGRYNAQANFSFLHKNHTIGGYFARNFNSGWSPDNNLRFKYYKPKVQYTGGLSYHLNTNRYEMSLKSDLLYEELHDLDSVHLNTVFNEQSDTSYLTFLATDYYHYTTRINTRLNYKRILNAKTWIGFQLGHSYYKKHKEAYIKDLVSLEQRLAQNTTFFDTSYYHSVLGKLSAYTEKLNKTEIQTGIDYSYEQSVSKRTIGEQSISDFAVFSNLLYKPVSQIHLQSGLRYIFNSTFKAPIIYSLNALYTNKKIYLRTSYSNSFRAPSVKELYFQFIDNNHHIIGNPDLLAEKGQNITFNGKYHSRIFGTSFSPQITLFHNSIENAIQLALDLNRPGWGYYINIPSSVYKTLGYSFQIQSVFFNDLSFQTGISTTGKSKLYEASQYSYSTNITTNIDYQIKNTKINIHLHYKYTSPYLDYVGTFNENLELSGITEQRFDAYHTMNIILNKKFANNKLSMSAGIKNLFNVSLIETKGAISIHGGGENTALAGYGRSYIVKLSYHFNKKNE